MTNAGAVTGINQFLERGKLEGQGATGMSDEEFQAKMYRDDPVAFKEMERRNANTLSSQGRFQPTVQVAPKAFVRAETPEQVERIAQMQQEQATALKYPMGTAAQRKGTTVADLQAQKVDRNGPQGWRYDEAERHASDPKGTTAAEQAAADAASYAEMFANAKAIPENQHKMRRDAIDEMNKGRALAESYNNPIPIGPNGKPTMTQEQRSDGQLAALKSSWAAQRRAMAVRKIGDRVTAAPTPEAVNAESAARENRAARVLREAPSAASARPAVSQVAPAEQPAPAAAAKAAPAAKAPAAAAAPAPAPAAAANATPAAAQTLKGQQSSNIGQTDGVAKVEPDTGPQIKPAAANAKLARDWSKAQFNDGMVSDTAKAMQPSPVTPTTPKPAAYTPFAETAAGKEFYGKWNKTRSDITTNSAQNAAENAKAHARLDQVESATDGYVTRGDQLGENTDHVAAAGAAAYNARMNVKRPSVSQLESGTAPMNVGMVSPQARAATADTVGSSTQSGNEAYLRSAQRQRQNLERGRTRAGGKMKMPSYSIHDRFLASREDGSKVPTPQPLAEPATAGEAFLRSSQKRQAKLTPQIGVDAGWMHRMRAPEGVRLGNRYLRTRV